MDNFKAELIGSLKPENMRRSFEAFFMQAKDIRQQLSEEKALLDRYLSCLLESASHAFADTASEDGSEAARMLGFLCADIVLEKGKYKRHPFYQRAKSYIESHPINCEDTSTKSTLYTIALTHDYLEAECEKLLKAQDEWTARTLTHTDLNALYRQICDVIGNEAGMKNLDRLFRERFLIATSLECFLQGMSSTLMYVLTKKDSETSKQVFQFLLDDA